MPNSSPAGDGLAQLEEFRPRLAHRAADPGADLDLALQKLVQ